jgi:hypothetical protein
MNIGQTAISLNVPDVDASATFAKSHFGYEEAMAAEGFVSLQHPLGRHKSDRPGHGPGDVQAR